MAGVLVSVLILGALGAASLAATDNIAPLIEPVPDQVVPQNETLVLPVQAQDPDGDPFVYELVESPAGMTIDPNGGVVTWEPGSGATGTYGATVRVTDSRGAVSTEGFAVTVPN